MSDVSVSLGRDIVRGRQGHLLSPGRVIRHPMRVSMSRLIEAFNSFATMTGASFAIRHKRMFKLLKPGKTNGAAAFHVLYKLLPMADKSLHMTNISIIGSHATTEDGFKCMTRGFSLCNGLSIVRGLRFFTNICNLCDRGGSSQVRTIVGRFHLGSIQSVVTNSLPNNCGRHLSVTTTLVRRPGVLFLSRPADNVSPLAQHGF